jgi:Na+/H+ antiporter NhaA
MTSEPTLPELVASGATAELQSGKLALRARTDVPFIAAVGAMVIGILLAVAAIIGTARPRR